MLAGKKQIKKKKNGVYYRSTEMWSTYFQQNLWIWWKNSNSALWNSARTNKYVCRKQLILSLYIMACKKQLLGIDLSAKKYSKTSREKNIFMNGMVKDFFSQDSKSLNQEEKDD